MGTRGMQIFGEDRAFSVGNDLGSGSMGVDKAAASLNAAVAVKSRRLKTRLSHECEEFPPVTDDMFVSWYNITPRQCDAVTGVFSVHELSDLLSRSAQDDDTIEITDDMIVPEERPTVTLESFIGRGSYEFDSLFSGRNELGISIDRFTKRLNDGNEMQLSRFRKKEKEGVSGRWVSRDYVREAVDALQEYDSITRSVDETRFDSAESASAMWDLTRSRLKKVSDIAERYFTAEARESAKGYAKIQLEKAASAVSRYTGSRFLERNAGLQAFAALSASDDMFLLGKSLEIADRCRIPESTVSRVKEKIAKAAWKRYEGSGRVVDSDVVEMPGHQPVRSEDTKVERVVAKHRPALPPGPYVAGIREDSRCWETDSLLSPKDEYAKLIMGGSTDLERAVNISSNHLERHYTDFAVRLWQTVSRLERERAAKAELGCESDSGVYMRTAGQDGAIERVKVSAGHDRQCSQGNVRKLSIRLPPPLPKDAYKKKPAGVLVRLQARNAAASNCSSQYSSAAVC